MNVVAIIPARMGSTRFPGKPMAPLQGIPMIGHVYERTRLSRTVSETYAATCDKEIHDYILSIGGKSVMTSDRHERASDRAAEAMLKIEEQTGQKVDIAVMVQGDEPMVFPEMIDAAVSLLLEDSTLDIACLMAAISGDKDFEDPNLVKVAVDLKSFALYFSREPIPSRKKWKGKLPMYKQVPIIPFKRDYLLRFNSLPPTPLEAIESVDLLRVLEHGDKVKMAITTRETLSVDTPADLKRADGAMQADKLLPSYRKAIAR